MNLFKSVLCAGTATILMTASVYAQSCGGDFSAWRAQMVEQAQSEGVNGAGLEALKNARIDQSILQKDRAQGVFTLDFIEFSRRLISQNRIDNGRKNLNKYASIFERARQEYGVAPEIITSFWAFETDYGAIQGDDLTVNAVTTLAHDCRRPELFRPQLIALAKLIDQGIVPADVTGAWAGEIGQIQVLPADYLTKGRDGDGDGRVELKTSAPDAIMTAANFLSKLGWQANQPWLQEVSVPDEMEWYDAGLHKRLPVSEWKARGVNAREGSLPENLEASLVLPMGRKGPAFLAYPNFTILLEWNQSLTYVLTAAYFGNRLGGAEIYNAGSNHDGLSADQVKSLQSKLSAAGYDVGKIDGIIGAGTRAAVREIQQKNGLPADAWPTEILFNYL
ncbi:lytic murein transglycosylase [Ahrensia marina]|uniref:Lytic transglycosylase n=1 Tax=Ahrensia marina TaxID=1514904 RepID=A0A0N0E7Y3_9HYPH|nr:lytic murein transglycosylase [Ahrensia marina]KPB01728.1 lytic transglycosylase [Ahrensia marina]